jgi:hypothetical protein
MPFPDTGCSHAASTTSTSGFIYESNRSISRKFLPVIPIICATVSFLILRSSPLSTKSTHLLLTALLLDLISAKAREDTLLAYLCLEQRHTYACFCSKECSSSNWKKPADMAETRVFYHDAFLSRAICTELAGQTMSLKEIRAARTVQRKTLRETLTDRQQVVERYLAVHRPPETRSLESEPSTPPPPRLNRLYSPPWISPMGLCYGAPGVGKTLSARHYTRWNLLEPIMLHPATKEARP